ncbi:MAG: tRNA uridine-5-carboxymethylaminomethyl(34) synthesis GTPase MnmE [Acidobacteriota bacterium]
MDTICAISTHPQPAAIGIVRASGPLARDAASRLFRPRNPAYPPYPHSRLVAGALVLPARKFPEISECLLCFFEGPKSYTGEDVCEFHCPGSPMLLGELMEELVRQGCRPAERGEFTRRAWENRRIDLPAAEVLNELIRARTREGMLLAASQMNPALSDRIAAARAALVDTISTLEAAIEFGETDGLSIDRCRMAARLEAQALEQDALAQSFSASRALREGCRVVITGKANTGKSTLFNYLAGCDRAIVHSRPGTTRDVLRETIELGRITVTLHDTAGFRETPSGDEVEAEGIRRTQDILSHSDGAIVVLDGSQPLESADRTVLDTARSKPHIVVLNKIDLGRDQAHQEGIEVSLTRGDGRERIVPAIEEKFGGTEAAQTAPMLMTLRQKRCVMRSASALHRAARVLRSGGDEEVAAEELREASEAMGDLAGEVTPQEVIDRVFSTFCIGK